jgi:hypothetical protein
MIRGTASANAATNSRPGTITTAEAASAQPRACGAPVSTAYAAARPRYTARIGTAVAALAPMYLPMSRAPGLAGVASRIGATRSRSSRMSRSASRQPYPIDSSACTWTARPTTAVLASAGRSLGSNRSRSRLPPISRNSTTVSAGTIHTDRLRNCMRNSYRRLAPSVRAVWLVILPPRQ